MDWLLFLLLPGTLLVLCNSFFCTSCDEFVGKTCRRNLDVCEPKYPDFACQTKEVYIQHFTGDYVYQYSILRCPKRCVEYVRITKWEKNVFSCCYENHCNNLSASNIVQLEERK
uniref:Uncharacterized protein n=1 Tax=Castor canadensis TaxID=51338 RepID=A0A8C0WBD5_CASCN